MKPVVELGGTPGETKKVTVGDTKTSLPEAVKYREGAGGSKRAERMRVTVEDNDIRYAFIVDPTDTASTGVGHLIGAGGTFWLRSFAEIENIQFINAVGASVGVIQVTPYFV